MVEEPVLTVVIPTFRRPVLLARTLRSVQLQTEKRLHVLVLDNASGDETTDVVRSFAKDDPRIEYVRHPVNIGASANFESGMLMAKTPFFAFLSDDDTLFPGCYEQALRALERYPSAGFAATRVINLDERGRALDATPGWRTGYYEPPEGLLRMLMSGIPIWTGIVFRREVIDVVGRFDPEVAGSSDTDFELRIAARMPYVLDASWGAVFSSRSVSAGEGATRPLDASWPGMFRTGEKLLNEKSLPEAARHEAARLYLDHCRNSLLRVALKYVYAGDRAQASRATRMIRDRGGLRGRSRILPWVIAATRFPPLASAYRLAIDLRGRARTRETDPEIAKALVQKRE